MEFILNNKRLPDHIVVDNTAIPLFGLVEVLACSRLFGDVNVLGNSATNCGFVVKYHQNKPISRRYSK